MNNNYNNINTNSSNSNGLNEELNTINNDVVLTNNSNNTNDENLISKNKMPVIFVITLILVVLGFGGYLLFKNISDKPNTGEEIKQKQEEQEKSEEYNNTEQALKSEDYHLIYEPLDFSSPYWNEKEKNFDTVTNKTAFDKKFAFQVKGSSRELYNSDMSLPYNPKFSIVGSYKDSNYNIRYDVNEKGFFYPSSIMYNFNHAQATELYILDNDLNFNKMQLLYEHNKKITKEKNLEMKIVEDTENWTVFKYNSEEKTRFLAEYYLNKEQGDFIQIKITLNGLITDEEFNYLTQKIKENLKITILPEKDKNYATLNDDKIIKVSSNMEIDTSKIIFQSWLGYGKNYSGILYTSIDFVHEISFTLMDKISEGNEYYPNITFTEYKDGVNYGLTGLLNVSIIGNNIKTSDLNYKNLKLKTIVSDNYDGREVLEGLSLELNNNYYLIRVKNVENNQEDISKLVEYLFEKVIIIK